MPRIRQFKALIESAFAQNIAERYGRQMLTLSDMAVKSMSPARVPHMQQENRLCSEYQAPAASCNISLERENCNIYGLL